MKKLLLFFLIFGVWFQVYAQQAILQERNYKANPNDTELDASTVDKNGNVFYSGATLLGNSEWANIFLLVKPDTDTLWTKRNPITIKSPYQSVVTLKSGQLIAGGSSWGQSNYAVTLHKLDHFGSFMWTNKYASKPSMVNTLLAFPDNSLLLGGGIGINGVFSFIRTDSLGNFLWSKDYSWGTLSERLVDMKFTPKGNIIAAGNTRYPVGPSHLKIMLVKQNGDSLNAKQLIITGPSRYEVMYPNYNSVTALTDGGYLLTAYTDTVTSTVPNGMGMGMVVKVDSAFNIKWHYVHRTSNLDEYMFTKAKELTDGSVLVLGFKQMPISGANLNGFQLYHFDPQGNLMQTYPFTSSICSQVWGLTFDALNDSTFMIGGRCGNNPPVSFGFYVAKVKVAGLPPVVPPFNVPAITGTKEELLAGTNLGQSYPNPTATEAIIPYSLPKNYSKASIMIREIATGREIRKYELKRNSSSLTVDLSNLSSGLYLYSLVVDDKPVATKKLAIMK